MVARRQRLQRAVECLHARADSHGARRAVAGESRGGLRQHGQGTSRDTGFRSGAHCPMGVPITWLEFEYSAHGNPKTRAKVVDRETASLDGEPFSALLDSGSWLPSMNGADLHGGTEGSHHRPALVANPEADPAPDSQVDRLPVRMSLRGRTGGSKRNASEGARSGSASRSRNSGMLPWRRLVTAR